MKDTSQKNETNNLLRELADYFCYTYFSDLRWTKLSLFLRPFDSLEKFQKYDLPTWSKAITYVCGKEVEFQDYQSIIDFLNHSTCP